MTGDGWAKGSTASGPRAARRPRFTIKTTPGNKRRELTEKVMQKQLKAAGFDMKIANERAGDLFGKILPRATTSCRSSPA